jgi:hypothetical protein
MEFRILRIEVVSFSTGLQQFRVILHHLELRARQSLEVGKRPCVIDVGVIQQQDANVLGLESELANGCFDQRRGSGHCAAEQNITRGGRDEEDAKPAGAHIINWSHDVEWISRFVPGLHAVTSCCAG